MSLGNKCLDCKEMVMEYDGVYIPYCMKYQQFLLCEWDNGKPIKGSIQRLASKCRDVKEVEGE